VGHPVYGWDPREPTRYDLVLNTGTLGLDARVDIIGHVAAIMSACNRIRGVYATEYRHTLTDILRTEWGFEGYVQSDFWSWPLGRPSPATWMRCSWRVGRWASVRRQAVICLRVSAPSAIRTVRSRSSGAPGATTTVFS
jgi:hypothetical protein